MPRGPTLSFRISSYTLLKDVITTIKRFKNVKNIHETAPLLIMNGFDENLPHHKLMTATFQNMLPAVNVKSVKLNTMRRCILLSYVPESDTVDIRHYSISAAPVGVNKAVKKLMKKVPNLSGYSDISEFLTNGYFSESDGEEGPDSQVVLPQTLAGRGNLKSTRSAIRLTELGPRISLQLVKIQEGVGEGEVLYHSFLKKTSEEKKKLRKKIEKQKLLKEQRRKEQAKNVERKKKETEERTKKRKRKDKYNPEEYSDDDDEQAYIDEVGSAPDADLMLRTKKPKVEPEPDPVRRTKRSGDFKRGDTKFKTTLKSEKKVTFSEKSESTSSKTKIVHTKTANVKGVAFRRKKS